MLKRVVGLLDLISEILRDGLLFWLGAFAFAAALLTFLWDEGAFFFSKGSLIVWLIGSLVGPAILSYEFLGPRFTLLAFVGFTIILAALAAASVAIVLAFAGARNGFARAVSKAAARRTNRIA